MIRTIPALLAGLLFSAGALAAAADSVTVQNPYVRLMPPGVPATAAFMVLKNGGDKAVKLVKTDSPAAKAVEMHTHSHAGGIMKMRQVPAIPIPAREQAVLQPGGLHLMLIDLKAPLQEGDAVTITLGFDDGSSKEVEARVVRAMPAGHAAAGH